VFGGGDPDVLEMQNYASIRVSLLKVWDIRSPTCLYGYDCGAAINTAVLCPNQMEIVTGDQTGCVMVR
jgi:hypothetical protein